MYKIFIILSIISLFSEFSFSSSFAMKDDISYRYKNQILPDQNIILNTGETPLSTDDLLLMIDMINYKTDSRANAIDNIIRSQVRAKGNGVDLKFAVDEESSYSITQGTSKFSANILGGLTSGIADIYSLYRYGTSINLASAATKATLMATSSYVGYIVGNYAEVTVVKPVVTTVLGAQVGTSIATVFGDVAGGSLVGSLFALGGYATGYTDRHLTRSMMIKSVAGSSVLAGTTFFLGSSTVTVGVFSVGTFLLPYLTAIGTYYLVDNFFQLTDKVEEAERISDMLSNVK